MDHPREQRFAIPGLRGPRNGKRHQPGISAAATEVKDRPLPVSDVAWLHRIPWRSDRRHASIRRLRPRAPRSADDDRNGSSSAHLDIVTASVVVASRKAPRSSGATSPRSVRHAHARRTTASRPSPVSSPSPGPRSGTGASPTRPGASVSVRDGDALVACPVCRLLPWLSFRPLAKQRPTWPTPTPSSCAPACDSLGFTATRLREADTRRTGPRALVNL